MNQVKWFFALFVITSLALFVYASTRPYPIIADARKNYTMQRPNNEILSLNLVEDEVACTTFIISVKKENGNVENQYIQYFHGKKGSWNIVDN